MSTKLTDFKEAHDKVVLVNYVLHTESVGYITSC